MISRPVHRLPKVLLWLAALTACLLIEPAFAGRLEFLEPLGPQPAVISPNGRKRVLYEESHALVISASRYSGVGRGGWRELPHAASEADELAAALRPHGFTVTQIYDPTGDELIRALRQFVARYGQKPNVRLFVFFSGHGYTSRQNGMGYLVPVDAKDPETDRIDFLAKALPISQLDQLAREIVSKHALFIFDSCFSGAIFDTRSKGVRPEAGSDKSARWNFLQGSAQQPVRQFISAGGANETVPGQSDLVPLLLRALRYGAPSSPDGYFTGIELGQWIAQTVPSLTHGLQNPHSALIQLPRLALGDVVFQLPDNMPAAALSRRASPERDDARNRDKGLKSVLDLQSRLGGRAVYSPFLDATFLVDANLPARLKLGLDQISSDGKVHWPVAIAWIAKLNACQYLGYSDWRLPKAVPLNGADFRDRHAGVPESAFDGSADIGPNVGAPGTEFHGTAKSELPYLYFTALGNESLIGQDGRPRRGRSFSNGPFQNLMRGEYWTGTELWGGAVDFDFDNGNQFSHAKNNEMRIMVARTGDSSEVGPASSVLNCDR